MKTTNIHSLHESRLDQQGLAGRIELWERSLPSVFARRAPLASEQDIRRGLERARRARAEAFSAAARGAGGWLSRRVRAVLAGIRRRRDERAAYAALAALDDRLLRDIGIGRGEIEAVVRGLRERREPSPAAPEAQRPQPRAEAPCPDRDRRACLAA